MQKRLISGALRAQQRHQDSAIFQFFLVNLPRTGKWAAETSGHCTACTSTFALRARPTGIRAARRDAALAQSVEHIIRNDGVTCSSHVSGTIFLFPDIPDPYPAYLPALSQQSVCFAAACIRAWNGGHTIRPRAMAGEEKRQHGSGKRTS